MSKSLKLFFFVADKTVHPLLENFFLCMLLLTHLTFCIQLMEERKRRRRKGRRERGGGGGGGGGGRVEERGGGRVEERGGGKVEERVGGIRCL